MAIPTKEELGFDPDALREKYRIERTKRHVEKRHLAKSASVRDVTGGRFSPRGVAVSVSVFGERGRKLRKSLG